MAESKHLPQGPGLNGLFQAAAPQKDYLLRICGNPQNHPCDLLLRSDTLKLVDILACGLWDSGGSPRVELPLDEFLRLAGYAATESSKNAVRRQLRESIDCLEALSMDWTEGNGRYSYRDIKLFDDIIYQNGRVSAYFGEDMAKYLLKCSSMPLPLPLLAIDGRSPHSYALGRRCLVHNAANKGREWQPSRVRSLLAVCPHTNRPAPQEKWPPSILERKVIAPFTAAMNTLMKCGILNWMFREPVCRNDYEGFSDSIVEFQVPDVNAPALPVETEAEPEYAPFDYDAFLALR